MMPDKQDLTRLLSSFPVACTNDVEEIRASFAQVYGRPVMEFAGQGRTLHTVINHCRLQHTELNYATYGADLNFEFPESGFASQIFPLGGKAEATVEGQSVVMDNRQSALVSSGVPITIKSNVAYERLILCVSSDSLSKTLSALTGVTIAAPIRVQPARALLDTPGRLLREQVMFLAGQINVSLAVPPLLLDEFEHALMVAFLRVNRHNYSYLLERDALEVTPADVRRAEDYIEANWQGPVTVEDLVAVTGVSALSLFRSFKRHRGYSPMQYLERVRLRYRH